MTTVTLTFARPQQIVRLRVDANAQGIGVILIQEKDKNWHPVAYISRT